MAKVKNKKNSGLADKVHNKRKTDINKKKLNPFEVHINREKQKVLGKKSKHDKGLPGVSRAKAIQKRKETIGTEMKLMNKTNTFIDRRIGEKNNQLSAEDRMIARFTAERAKQHTKKNIYNLADDEILTHRGQTLEQIEKFDDPKSSDDEAEEGRGFGGLDDEFVSEGHFGGGMLSKSDLKDGAKSHKDLIEQLIAESKKRKAEKQKEKEQTLDLTEKLDSEWKDLQPVVFKRPKVEEKESAIEKLLSQAEKRSQDYDKMMRELKFEKRGTPSDGLKSNEKAEKEEREKLELWERERQQRMLGEEVVAAKKQPVVKHRSAEDLDDNFELDDEHDFMLAYDKDGKPLVPEHILKDYSVPNGKPKFNDGVSDTSSDDDGDDEDEDDVSDVEQDNSTSEKTVNVKTIKNKKHISATDNSDSEDSDDDDDDDDEVIENKNSKKHILNDASKELGGNELIFKISNDTDESSDDDDEEITVSKKVNDKKDTKKSSVKDVKSKVEEKGGLFQNSDDNNQSEDEEEEEEEDDDEESEAEVDEFDDLKDLRQSDAESEDETQVQEDQKKIGSFFEIKSSEGDKLKELLTGKTPAQQSIALQKLIKSHDPSLAENNKDLLSRLFAHLLQYLNDLFTGLKEEGEVIKSFLIFDRLAPHLYDLAITNKVSTKKYLMEVIKEKYDIFKKHPKRVPDLETLIFFKLVSLIYPTSDFRHPVTTPSLIFMSEILTLSRFRDAYSVSRGIFITALILEFTVLSKRFVPSAISFLRGIIYLSANTSVLHPIHVVPPFRLFRDMKMLTLENDCTKMVVKNKMTAADLVLSEINDDFKIRCLLSSVVMLKEYFDNCNDMEAQECIFEPHIKLLRRVDMDLYPKKVYGVVTDVLQYMKESLEVKTYTPLSREKKRPKALRLYEPDVQEVFTGSKSAKLSREESERARLQTKYKREMKGALREIRRDKSFIASVKIRQKIHSDNIRKDKVKQIYKDAAVQQGELNKLKRMK